MLLLGDMIDTCRRNGALRWRDCVTTYYTCTLHLEARHVTSMARAWLQRIQASRYAICPAYSSQATLLERDFQLLVDVSSQLKQAKEGLENVKGDSFEVRDAFEVAQVRSSSGNLAILFCVREAFVVIQVLRSYIFATLRLSSIYRSFHG